MAKKSVNYRPSRAQAWPGFIVGLVFIALGVFLVIPMTARGGVPTLLFGLLWTGISVYNTVFQAKILFGSEEETEDLFGGFVITEDAPAEMEGSTEVHDHVPSTALDAEKRLEQLERLKAAGLITNEEFKEKRREIIDEL